MNERPVLPPRPIDAHKGTFGTVAVIAGRAGMLGAAILCARASLRSGAGLVRVVVDDAVCRAALVAAVPGATTMPRSTTAAYEWFDRARAAVVGPGIGIDRDAERAVDAGLGFLGSLNGCVFDADALNVLASRTESPVVRPGLVVTPHPGEAARLLAVTTAEIQADRDAAAKALCRRTGAAVCVLKGHHTVVTDGVRIERNATGNSGMATGGSGDVLTGVIAAFLAAGMDPFHAARFGVHVHGAAGDRVAAQRSSTGLVAEDLPDAVAAELQAHERVPGVEAVDD